MSHPNDYARPRGEQFEVVLCKKGVNPLQGTPEDFSRVQVVASDPTEAVNSEAAIKAAGDAYTIVQAAKPMVPTDFEHMARLRAQQEKPFDRVNI